MADKEAIPPPPEPHNTAPVLETENKEDDETTKEPAVVTATEVEGSSDEAAGDKLASPADLEVPSEPPLEVRQWFGRSVYWQVYVPAGTFAVFYRFSLVTY